MVGVGAPSISSMQKKTTFLWIQKKKIDSTLTQNNAIWTFIIAQYRFHLCAILKGQFECVRTAIVGRVNFKHRISSVTGNCVGQRCFAQTRRSAEEGHFLYRPSETVHVRIQFVQWFLAKSVERFEFTRLFVETIFRARFDRVNVKFSAMEKFGIGFFFCRNSFNRLLNWPMIHIAGLRLPRTKYATTRNTLLLARAELFRKHIFIK